jgi:hypothetical protein
MLGKDQERLDMSQVAAITLLLLGPRYPSFRQAGKAHCIWWRFYRYGAVGYLRP